MSSFFCSLWYIKYPGVKGNETVWKGGNQVKKDGACPVKVLIYPTEEEDPLKTMKMSEKDHMGSRVEDN